MVGFSEILGISQAQDKKMMKGKLIDGKKNVSKFRGKLVKTIRDAGSKFDDYSIRQILLHWGYELTEKDFFKKLKNQEIDKLTYKNELLLA